MGYYKVPQNIEAEDTILGPLTFKQMIFLIVAGVLGFFGFLLAQISPFFFILIGPPFAAFLILGVYRPEDQPVENKLAAYLGFYFKPRKKVWSRDGIVDHVTITAPKTPLKRRTDDRTPEQVRSQLKQLAQVVDTRGLSANQTNVYSPTTLPADDDRIVPVPAPTRQIDDSQTHTEDNDMFDLDNNPVAQKVTELTEASAKKNRAEALAHMKHPDKPQAPREAIDRQQTYPTQPQEPQAQTQNPNTQTQSPSPSTVFRPQTKAQPDEDEQLEPLHPLRPSDVAPTYNPYPSHMRQHVLQRDGTLSGADTSIDTPSAPQPTQQTHTPPPPPSPEQGIDESSKNELKNLADAGFNIEALQRHGQELEQERAGDGTSGEIVIEH